MKFSKFGDKFTAESGILKLMNDLGNAIAESVAGKGDIYMLGGGNPAHIPLVQQHFREQMEELLASTNGFENAVGNYSSAVGEIRFCESLARLLTKELNTEIKPSNIALTNGSQNAFFFLFNLLGGTTTEGVKRKILLPLAPEYIGYADAGLEDDFFVAAQPLMRQTAKNRFKYYIDFAKVNEILKNDEIAAICVSRPTNPTGNVLTDTEVAKLTIIAEENNIPLIIDNAYGTPFPNIIFTEATPVWNENIILSMSLSKLGLPSSRTGIVVACEEIVEAISKMNAIINLAPNGMGVAVASKIVETGEIIHLSKNVIRPYYEQRSQAAAKKLDEALCHAGIDYYLHEQEGALFLWLWLPTLPISCEQLYNRLKDRGVIVVSGHYFFTGLDEDSLDDFGKIVNANYSDGDMLPFNKKHLDQCLRISFVMEEQIINKGLEILADEIKQVFDEFE
ncbi:valine--pyruvate transaminase [Lentisphaerota bacterium WC36G]|nr:valine--pyruvate transaminase [Lentisphaerae bacterium WC36]